MKTLPKKLKKKAEQGFTLIEILVVMAILAVLAMLIVGAIILAREQARMTQAINFDHGIDSSMKDSQIVGWKFDEGSSPAADEMGNTSFAFGAGTSDAGFDGGNAIKIANASSSSQALSSSIGPLSTISFWFKLPDINETTGGTLVAAGRDSGSGCTSAVTVYIYRPASSTNGIYRLAVNIGAATTQSLYSNLYISDTKWHHVAFSQSVDTKICLDGQCQSPVNGSGATVSDLSSYIVPKIGYVRIGSGIFCGNGYFDTGVTVDNLRYYSKSF